MRILVVLVCFLGAVFAIPQGFTTFFRGSTCPSGWAPLDIAAGRLVVSVSSFEDAEITVGVPLADMEDRTHNHSIDTTVYLDVKSISAIGCCNPDGACYGSYPFSGLTTNEPSGMPFVQLLLCTVTNPDDQGVIPYGTIGFFANTSFSKSSCSDFGPWGEFDTATGRSLIPGVTTGLQLSEADPLKSGEDRIHDHHFETTIVPNDQSYAGVAGCCDKKLADDKNYPVSDDTSASSRNIPYVQLLTCISQNQTFNAALPSEAYIFNSIQCPPGYQISEVLQGRFVVALPNGGTPGAIFGGDSIAIGGTHGNNHTHPFNTHLDTKECEVGLASGCCGSGYVHNQQYTQSGITDVTVADFPFVSVPVCEPIS